MSEYRTIETLRIMEWERVKGSLNALVKSIWDDEKEYERYRNNVDKFIRAMDDGWELFLEDGADIETEPKESEDD